METFGYGGHPVAYVRRGAGDPVILLHNGGMSHAIWRHQIEALARSREVFALDLPGYGRSPGPPGGLTLHGYADLLGAFAGHVARGPVALAGNCMGAAISLTYARRRPAAVSALVLVNPLTEATFTRGVLGGLHLAGRYAPGIARPVARAAARWRVPEKAARRMLRLQLGRGDGELTRDPELLACWANPHQIRTLTGTLQDMSSYGALDRIGPGEDLPPLYVIWGGRNRILPARAGARLVARLRPRAAVNLRDAGHLPMLEAPETVTGLIERFLADAGTAPARRSRSRSRSQEQVPAEARAVAAQAQAAATEAQAAAADARDGA
ncbi:alpha/beta fold hydrolase [Bailinhaonella thermotolerans]|uniref:Alpha/beta fold hydrolase n=1 Tax=Bailinhaonella thermotolerans TaxID=1070861 RepID=A0A3A4AW22_9ACTN|nr:alpha/beta fold hydrolase [Bailinhaonella thermotolerans]RJL34075.1 alpha/beta fold hydrolase [Bailinhaonella thermotolerans]